MMMKKILTQLLFSMMLLPFAIFAGLTTRIPVNIEVSRLGGSQDQDPITFSFVLTPALKNLDEWDGSQKPSLMLQPNSQPLVDQFVLWNYAGNIISGSISVEITVMLPDQSLPLTDTETVNIIDNQIVLIPQKTIYSSSKDIMCYFSADSVATGGEIILQCGAWSDG